MAPDSLTEPALGALAFPDRRVLTVREVATRLRCSPRHVRNLIAGGALRSLDIAAPHTSLACWRVPVDSFIGFVVARSRGRSLGEILSGCSRPVLLAAHREIGRALEVARA